MITKIPKQAIIEEDLINLEGEFNETLDSIRLTANERDILKDCFDKLLTISYKLNK